MPARRRNSDDDVEYVDVSDAACRLSTYTLIAYFFAASVGFHEAYALDNNAYKDDGVPWPIRVARFFSVVAFALLFLDLLCCTKMRCIGVMNYELFFKPNAPYRMRHDATTTTIDAV